MKPYPEYKPTGLAWLPEIPKHWKSAKLRELFTERIQKASDKEFAPLSVSKGGIVPQIATVAKTDNGDNRKRVKVGDFVINSRSDRKGSSGISAYDGSVSLINIVLNPRAKENGRFLHYLLKSIPFTEEYYRNGRGIVADLWTTRYSEMKTISVPVPPADEQAQPLGRVLVLQGAGGGKIAFLVGEGRDLAVDPEPAGGVVKVEVFGNAVIRDAQRTGAGEHLRKRRLSVGGEGAVRMDIGQHDCSISRPPVFVNLTKRAAPSQNSSAASPTSAR